MITTDQQRWDYMSLHGTPGVRTPVLDKLATEGMYFPRTYCVMPMCVPTRVSLLSGQYPSRHGAYSIGVMTRFTFPTLPGLLGESGYNTSMIGKTHFVPRNLEAAHVAGVENPEPLPDPVRMYKEDGDFWDTYDGPYVGFDFVRHMHGHTTGRIPCEHYRAWLRKKGADLEQMDAWHEGKKYRYGSWPIPEELHQTAWITEEATDWITRQQKTDKPWFSWVSYQDPHMPFVCPEPYYSEVDMTGVDLGGHTPGEFDDKPSWYKRFNETGAYEDGIGKFYDDNWGCPAINNYNRVEKPHEAIQAYIGMCNMIDVYLGKLLDSLREAGALENTLIVFTSDHGDYLGQHGFWQKGLPAYDDAQRVPLVAWWPEGMKNATKGCKNALFSLVDLPQTLLSAAGLPPAPGMQGVDQMPVLRGEADCARDWALVECMPTHKYYQETLVTDQYKLVVYRNEPDGELYDVVADPNQMKNLWSLPEHQAAKADMMHRFAKASMEKDGGWPPRTCNA